MTAGDPANGSGGAYRRTTRATTHDALNHTQDQAYLDQQVLDSLLGLASGNSDGGNFIGSHPQWSAPDAAVSGTTYPGLMSESSDHLWSGDMAQTEPISHGENSSWFGHDLSYEDPAQELSNLQWPLHGPVTRPSDNINWSAAVEEQELRGRRGLPRRRSRYRYMQSEQRAVPIPIPASPTTQQDSDPLQRWKDSPPQDEPASMAAIFDALRTNQVDSQDGHSRPKPAYSRANSGTSADSGGSSSSMQSANSAWSGISEASRGRRAGFGPLNRTRQGRVGKKRGSITTKDNRPFKYPTDEHLDMHNHSACHDRPIEARSFGRKDHLVQHLRVMHKLEKLPRFDDWKVQSMEITSRCGFCGMALLTWNKRTDHLAAHFRKGLTMKDWKGEHGFTPAVAEQVVHALPPYLIGSESMSVVPFSATKQGTKDHFAQISSRTHGFKDTAGELSTELKEPDSLPSPSVLTSRAATSKAFTEILERHLKHFADEYMAQGINPTDDMLRQESRRVIYDSDDEWNQTVADNSEWLAQFRTRHGLEIKGDQDKTIEKT
uniref:HTH CENPB-type domain-containing protein n=1 Tax=Colletotrichum fructicola (strain Nara gc5) TaxID=1213859 RepID=L2FDN6_COLFN